MHGMGMEADVEATVPRARRKRRQPAACSTSLHPGPRLHGAQDEDRFRLAVSSWTRLAGQAVHVAAIGNDAPRRDRRFAVGICEVVLFQPRVRRPCNFTTAGARAMAEKDPASGTNWGMVLPAVRR